MTQFNVYIINPVFMGFQIYIFPILRVFWSILVKCCVHLPTSSSKTQMLLLQRLYSTNIDCFVRHSSRLKLTFVAFCLLSVIRKQQLKQCNFSVDQSALLTGFRTDFTSSAWNFCLFLHAKRPQRRRARINGCFCRKLFSSFYPVSNT